MKINGKEATVEEAVAAVNERINAKLADKDAEIVKLKSESAWKQMRIEVDAAMIAKLKAQLAKVIEIHTSDDDEITRDCLLYDYLEEQGLVEK